MCDEDIEAQRRKMKSIIVVIIEGFLKDRVSLRACLFGLFLGFYLSATLTYFYLMSDKINSITIQPHKFDLQFRSAKIKDDDAPSRASFRRLRMSNLELNQPESRIGTEIGGSKNKVSPGTDENLVKLCHVPQLLMLLDHKAITICHHYWIDEYNNVVNMIVEYRCSGNLAKNIKTHHRQKMIPFGDCAIDLLQNDPFLAVVAESSNASSSILDRLIIKEIEFQNGTLLIKLQGTYHHLSNCISLKLIIDLDNKVRTIVFEFILRLDTVRDMMDAMNSEFKLFSDDEVVLVSDIMIHIVTQLQADEPSIAGLGKIGICNSYFSRNIQVKMLQIGQAKHSLEQKPTQHTLPKCVATADAEWKARSDV